MLQGMDQSEFGQFVAALWEQKGWQTRLKRDDGRTVVAVQRPETGEEGLLWAVPGDGEVGGQEVQQFRSLCDEYDIAEGGIVTAGSVSDHAEKVAEGTGIELRDGETVVGFLEREGLTGLVEQYAGDGTASASDASDGGASPETDGDSPLDRLRAVGGRASALVSDAVGDDLPVSGLLLAVVVVVAVAGAGVVPAPSVPFLGGSDAPVSAESASPDDADTSLSVSWNAKVTDELDPNESDELAYYPPDGEQFVVVRLSVNNTGDDQVSLTQGGFDLRADGETYHHQGFRDHDGFLDFPISPGQRYVGWTVFSVPEGTTGTLVYDQNATDASVAVAFEHDPDLAVNVTRR